jgi:23S rRNA pseudouridine955/2504/2580 synthase
MEKIDVLYEDGDLIAVHKPAGLPSQPTVDKKRPDLFTKLKSQLNTQSLYLHHRLDKDTSGVILFSKSKRANPILTEMFRQHQFEKVYWCLTKPHPDLKKEWEISNHLIARRKLKSSVKMFRTESGGDFAHTLFKLIHQNENAALIEARPRTGRTHQIRVHLLHSQIPILGDSLYGGKDTRVPRLMLHAKTLEFTHPIKKNKLTIEALLPNDFQSLGKKWQLLLV